MAASREITIGHLPANVNVSLNANLNAQADLMLLSPSYTLHRPCWAGSSRLA